MTRLCLATGDAVVVTTEQRDADSNTQRIEAFSDGVFAIAITLLILEIRLPPLRGSGGIRSLEAALLGLWPSYLAYVLSFLMIGIYWANHHYIFRLYKRTDHLFNLLNVLFLMCIAFLPFPTAVLGGLVTDPREQRTAVMFYAFGLLLPAFTWFLTWLYASRQYRLIDTGLDPGFVRLLTAQYVLSNVLYLAALLTSLWSAVTSLAICVGLTLLYMFPPRKPVYLRKV